VTYYAGTCRSRDLALEDRPLITLLKSPTGNTIGKSTASKICAANRYHAPRLTTKTKAPPVLK
jgi:hypothetical protein